MQLSEQQIQKLKSYINQLKPTFLGYLLSCLVKSNKSVVMSNIDRVFGDVLSAEEKKILSLSIFSHRVKLIKELIGYRLLTKKQLMARTKFIKTEFVLQLIRKNVPVIFIGAHLGNWELLFSSLKNHLPEVANKFSMVRKLFKPQWLSNIIIAKMQKSGVKIIATADGIGTIINRLKGNKTIGLTIDNFPKKNCVIVNFLGQPTRCNRAAAILAKKTKAWVIPWNIYRDKNSLHVGEFFPAIPWISCDTAEEEILANAQQYNTIIEQFILAHPEQWLMWGYRRWR